MTYYPVSLRLEGERVLIIGGGRVALRKIPALLAAGARISLVAPKILPGIMALARRNLSCSRRRYRTSDLKAARLVIAATDDLALQKRIAAGCKARRIWVNVVDAAPLCDFIVPATLRRGEVTIAVSTGGGAPALAKHLRQKISGALGKEYAPLARMMRQVRPEVLKWGAARRRTFWNKVASNEFLKDIRRNGAARAQRRLKEWVYGNRSL
jgi:siroheme synthase-like protein